MYVPQNTIFIFPANESCQAFRNYINVRKCAFLHLKYFSISAFFLFTCKENFVFFFCSHLAAVRLRTLQ